MLNQFIRYGAISAKVRVMYGKRLKEQDYSELLKKQTVTDIAAFLKKHPAYEKPLLNINEKLIHRGQLEGILRRIFYELSFKIFSFTPQNEHNFFSTLIIRMEIDEIVNCLRMLKAGKINEFILQVPEFIVKESKLNFVKMSAAENFEEFLNSLSKTEYKPVLEKFKDRELDITAIEVELVSFYYKKVYEFIDKNFLGKEKQTLLNIVGTQIDFQNITRIMRMKKFFNIEHSHMKEYLIPYNYLLNDNQIHSLLEAKDEEEIFSVLKKTSYRTFFNKINDKPAIEEYYYSYMYGLYHRIIRSEPSVNVPLSFLFLKDIEIRNLINIIEGVRYKEDTASIRRHLTGI